MAGALGLHGLGPLTPEAAVLCGRIGAGARLLVGRATR